MNHTIKSIIIVVLITSMLVLGTSMIPIMQNSFASKKHDFKGADRDPNTNTNTNSADSTSTSTAAADNTNNITNSATASNSQDQSACAVALTCPEGSTTITPPTTGTLIITKICNPAGSFALCEATTFSITVTGNNPVTPSSFSLTHLESQTVTLGPGSFTVHESVPADFEPPGFTGNCEQTARRSPDATGIISAGETLHCTITNTVGPG